VRSTASYDNTRRIWERRTGPKPPHAPRPTAVVIAVRTSQPDGHRAVSASRDYTLRVWPRTATASARSRPTGSSVEGSHHAGGHRASRVWDYNAAVWALLRKPGQRLPHAPRPHPFGWTGSPSRRTGTAGGRRPGLHDEGLGLRNGDKPPHSSKATAVM